MQVTEANLLIGTKGIYWKTKWVLTDTYSKENVRKQLREEHRPGVCADQGIRL